MIRKATRHVQWRGTSVEIFPVPVQPRQFDCLRSELRDSERGGVGHVVAVFNIGVTGTDAIVKIVDHWTLRDGKAISLFRAAGRARETRDQASGRRRGLDDIRNTRRIAKMYLSGVEVDRAALRQSLNR
jgi:hypothetical protein